MFFLKLAVLCGGSRCTSLNNLYLQKVGIVPYSTPQNFNFIGSQIPNFKNILITEHLLQNCFPKSQKVTLLLNSSCAKNDNFLFVCIFFFKFLRSFYFRDKPNASWKISALLLLKLSHLILDIVQSLPLQSWQNLNCCLTLLKLKLLFLQLWICFQSTCLRK